MNVNFFHANVFLLDKKQTFLRKFEVQNQRSKDGEIARLNDTIKSQNKRIIQLEETVDRLQQVTLNNYQAHN